MARAIKQFRFFTEGNSKNQPIEQDLISKYVRGSVFDGYAPILQLGVQTLPGTKFYVNNSPDPIIVGYTGIYELDLDNRAEILHLSFGADSMNLINSSENGYLIVDILYENNEEV